MPIPLVASTAAKAEASQIIGTINGVIQTINSQVLIGATAPTSLRNVVIGGDFSTNLWQRGTSFAAITNSTTYTADRFYAIGGASSSIAVSRQSTTALPGFSQKLRFQRTAANADTTAIKLNYLIASEDLLQMQGLPFVLSFYALAGSNYSQASSVLSVSMTTGTVADEGNSAYNAGTWTGTAGVTLIGSTGVTATGVTLTTSFQRFVLAGVIPTAALEAGITWSVTPVGTAGTNDFFEMCGVQLEVMPQGGVQPTPFERRPVQLERQLQQRYTQVLPDTGGVVFQPMASGIATTTTVALVPLPIAVPFRIAPTTTYPLASAGGFILQTGVGTKTGTLNMTQAVTSTVNSVMAQCTAPTAVLAASTPVIFGGSNGAVAITMSAEL